MGLGERLKYARERAGLTLEQVHKRVGVGVSSLSEFENGKREPRMSQLQALAATYRRSLAFLMGEEPMPQEVVLWRKQPKSPAAEEIEARFLQLCGHYHNLETWCRDSKPCRLPETSADADSFGYPAAEAHAHEVRRLLQLGDHPADCLLRVLEEVCGVKVFHMAFEPTGVAACAVSTTFGGAILLNSGNVRWRRNFDLAHELFHILTWKTFPKAGNRVEAGEMEEKYATCFARNLLMPTEVLRDSVGRAVRDHKMRLASFFDLAREYDVSVEALIWHITIEYRLDERTAKRLQEQCEAAKAFFEERRSDTPCERPERFRALALKTLRMGEISIGRFAEYMGISRAEALRYAEQEVVDDEEVEIAPA